MTWVVGVNKCVAIYWCGVVVVILQRVVTGKIRETAKTERGTQGAKRRSTHSATCGRAVGATSSAGSATGHMKSPLDWFSYSEPIKHGHSTASFATSSRAPAIAVANFEWTVELDTKRVTLGQNTVVSGADVRDPQPRISDFKSYPTTLVTAR